MKGGGDGDCEFKGLMIKRKIKIDFQGGDDESGF
jgi:hypothetical protein